MKCKRCLKIFVGRRLKGKKRRDQLCTECRDEISNDIREERAYWQNKSEEKIGEKWQ